MPDSNCSNAATQAQSAGQPEPPRKTPEQSAASLVQPPETPKQSASPLAQPPAQAAVPAQAAAAPEKTPALGSALMAVPVTLCEQDMVASCRVTRLCVPQAQRRKWLLRAVAFAAFAAALLCIGWIFAHRAPLWPSLGLLVLVLVFLMIGFSITGRENDRHCGHVSWKRFLKITQKSPNGMRLCVTYTFYENGFSILDNGFTTTAEYSVFHQLCSCGGVLFLFLAPRNGYLIPRRELEPGQETALKELLAQKTGLAWEEF